MHASGITHVGFILIWGKIFIYVIKLINQRKIISPEKICCSSSQNFCSSKNLRPLMLVWTRGFIFGSFGVHL
jgi:hypothetical protein